MFWCVRQVTDPISQRGQVLAEAVVVLGLLVGLVVAVHLSGRLQYQWLKQWLAVQIAGDAVALDHARLPSQASVRGEDINRWHKSAMGEFAVGESNWRRITTKGRFAQTAWRLAGDGNASLDKTVTARIEAAPSLWRKTELTSKAVVHALLPTIKAVEAPWDSRGSETDWLGKWEGHTPRAYLRSEAR